MGKSYKRILLLGIGFILCGTLAAQEQKQDSTEGKNNIKASEYLMQKSSIRREDRNICFSLSDRVSVICLT